MVAMHPVPRLLLPLHQLQWVHLQLQWMRNHLISTLKLTVSDCMRSTYDSSSLHCNLRSIAQRILLMPRLALRLHCIMLPEVAPNRLLIHPHSHSKTGTVCPSVSRFETAISKRSSSGGQITPSSSLSRPEYYLAWWLCPSWSLCQLLLRPISVRLDRSVV